MKRNIKFRAWDKDSSEMYYTENHPVEDMYFDFKNNNIVLLSPIEDDFAEERDCIIMQYTGLIDKNGVEICEGDIVVYDRGVGNWTGKRMATIHEIVFNDEVFAFVMKYDSSYIKLRKHWNYIYEVIGNIHENPELIKKL